DVQQRQHRARLPAPRILGDDPLRPLKILGREGEDGGLRDVVHRSISPNTISIEPMIATTSASMWPLDRKSIACRKAKPGARILQRYGGWVPSATRTTPTSPLGALTAV